ncbi:hypothetical protein cypCar_00036171 [Cyprinus carpio]|nr:hypothetical protein cypCar_00036171 [Cyprinus carpio]
MKEKEAHVVNINGSKNQNYTISIKDKHNEIRAEQISNQTAFEIPFEWLKPCTVYTVSVDDCKLSGNNTFTSSIKPLINFNETIPSQFEWMNKPARCNATLIINCTNNENNWQKNGRFQQRSTSLEISWNSLEGDKCSGIKWDSYSVNYKIRGSDGSSDHNDKAVVGFLVFLIIVTSVALLFVLFKIYLLKRKRTAEDEEIPLTPEPLRRVEPIYADGLVEAYKTKIADESRLFMDEFQSIPRIFSNYTIKEAKKQENQSKNRYVDILPYDYNRVTLSAGGEDDYINASFIEGYQEPKKYIAAQGPKDETVCDFWQMVWEQKSSIIVMVTRCEEGNKKREKASERESLISSSSAGLTMGVPGDRQPASEAQEKSQTLQELLQWPDCDPLQAQYILIHTALIEHTMFGETEVSLSEFHSVLNTLRQKDGSDPSLLEMEFQKLPKFKKWRTINTGSSEDNKKKNRYSDVIPWLLVSKESDRSTGTFTKHDGRVPAHAVPATN